MTAQVLRTTHFSSAPLCEAIDAFLAERDLAAGTRRKYGATLEVLRAELGAELAVADVEGRALVSLFARHWGEVAPATWNRQRACLRSFFAFCGRQRWLVEDPSEALERRRDPEDQTRSIPAAELERLWRRRDVPLRERTFWHLLFETAARAQEILDLDVEDVDLANRRAVVRGKGGGRELVHFQTRSGRLLSRLLEGRRSGPVFLASIRPAPARAPAWADLDPESGRARLSYRRAAELFSEYSSGRTLHQLRHTALTELAEANVSLPLLMAKSRHKSLRSLQRYARPGPEAVASLTAAMDPERRRGRRST
jgi:integrase/recombinase XerC/integrase/recombinase XerD